MTAYSMQLTIPMKIKLSVQGKIQVVSELLYIEAINLMHVDIKINRPNGGIITV